MHRHRIRWNDDDDDDDGDDGGGVFQGFQVCQAYCILYTSTHYMI